ncbi:MarR family winged helix-turn-helix transcriptional regulator [Cytobacillus gottheilii]|uniref:MarR family winged helix-turn-helix transcriptional regulator n=1 Tax=Cytobacillus gottheilii TaxID=859144 RepID=UPI00159446CA|nr:MarR family transcriptional regulator [Cytobacillus gottheilii]
MEDQSSQRVTDILKSVERVNRGLRKLFQKTAADLDLTAPQLMLLSIIASKKEVTQKQLGIEIQIPKSTLSQTIDALVQRELLERYPVEGNRREMQLVLSKQGKTLIDSIHEQKGSYYTVLKEAVDGLSEQKANLLLSSLSQIALFLEEEMKE